MTTGAGGAATTWRSWRRVTARAVLTSAGREARWGTPPGEHVGTCVAVTGDVTDGVLVTAQPDCPALQPVRHLLVGVVRVRAENIGQAC
jgi:hypothetical protein